MEKTDTEIEGSDIKYYHDSADPKDNKKTSPPEDEKITIPALWAFEVYTPSYIANLHDGIKNHGWSENEWNLSSDFQNTLNKLRYRASGYGWINLGYIIDIENESWWPNTKKTKLPKGIKAIKGSLLQFLPSTTIFACQFILDDELASSIEIPLRETYSTFKEKINGGHIYNDVIHQKEDAVLLAREYLKNLCTSWFSQNFPGLFSSGNFGKTFPTCEYLTFEKYSPSNEKEIKFSRDYLYILGLSDNFDTWHCDQLAGLFLQLKYDMKNIVLYGNYHEILSNKDLKSYGTEKKDRILNFLNYIDITLGIWVLQCLTSTFENRLTKLRDSYGTIDINKLSTEPSLLVELDTKVLENQKNISPFLHELKSFCEHQGSFMHDIYEFKATHKMYKNDDGLFNTIRKNLMFLGDYLSRNEKLLQNTANANRQIATVISSNDVAKTNIGLQKQMNLMTLVILFFTIIASVSAIIEIQKKFDLYAIFRNVIIYIKSII